MPLYGKKLAGTPMINGVGINNSLKNPAFAFEEIVSNLPVQHQSYMSVTME